MKDIAIYGAGGFGREVACLIKRINESYPEPVWNLVGFFDDGLENGTQVSHFGTCLGGMEELNHWKTSLDVCIAIGKGSTVEKIVGKITNSQVAFPNVIHPQVVFNDKESLQMGRGNIIQANCSFSCDVTIGDFNVMNGSVVFGHDAIVGNYNSFMPAIRVSGEVKIGNCNFFGVGSIILQQLTIKNDTTLAAGSVLMTRPKEGGLYIGVPAKMMKI